MKLAAIASEWFGFLLIRRMVFKGQLDSRSQRWMMRILLALIIFSSLMVSLSIILGKGK